MAVSERSGKVLGAVIREYIMTAGPVGSKAIAVKYRLGVSPATVRAIMAELEDMGLLFHPHTSAGRVPTEAGFKLYVRDLINPEAGNPPEGGNPPGEGNSPGDPPEEYKELLRKSCSAGRGAEALLHDIAKNLSALTSCAGVMFTPRKRNFVIKDIKLVEVDSSGLIVVLVSRAGAVQTKFIRHGLEPGRLDLERINNYLNSIAGGLTLSELRGRIASEMKREKNLYDELLSKALILGSLALEVEDREAEGKESLYLEGMARVLDQPEFSGDIERMKGLFAAFEEKSLLIKILDKGMEEGGEHPLRGLAPFGGIKVYFGSDCDVKEFEGLGFVTAPYGPSGAGDTVMGTLGVVGPLRMDYSRIIPLVGYTAGLLGSVFAPDGCGAAFSLNQR